MTSLPTGFNITFVPIQLNGRTPETPLNVTVHQCLIWPQVSGDSEQTDMLYILHMQGGLIVVR